VLPSISQTSERKTLSIPLLKEDGGKEEEEEDEKEKCKRERGSSEYIDRDRDSFRP
jgi:hypothetical protein